MLHLNPNIKRTNLNIFIMMCLLFHIKPIILVFFVHFRRVPPPHLNPNIRWKILNTVVVCLLLRINPNILVFIVILLHSSLLFAFFFHHCCFPLCRLPMPCVSIVHLYHLSLFFYLCPFVSIVHLHCAHLLSLLQHNLIFYLFRWNTLHFNFPFF